MYFAKPPEVGPATRKSKMTLEKFFNSREELPRELVNWKMLKSYKSSEFCQFLADFYLESGKIFKFHISSVFPENFR